MRYMLTDELWAALEPLVRAAKTHKGGQPPRAIFEVVLLQVGGQLEHDGLTAQQFPPVEAEFNSLPDDGFVLHQRRNVGGGEGDGVGFVERGGELVRRHSALRSGSRSRGGR